MEGMGLYLFGGILYSFEISLDISISYIISHNYTEKYVLTTPMRAYALFLKHNNLYGSIWC